MNTKANNNKNKKEMQPVHKRLIKLQDSLIQKRKRLQEEVNEATVALERDLEFIFEEIK